MKNENTNQKPSPDEARLPIKKKGQAVRSETTKPSHNDQTGSGDLADAPSRNQSESSVLEEEGRSPVLDFYNKLTLIGEDRAGLREKRGLSDEMIDRLGFRSNVMENFIALEALRAGYSELQLVRSGLWKQGDVPKPSAKFHGFGIVGKKKNLPREWLESGDYDALEDDAFVWDQKESGRCNPILIPYYDLTGRLFGLRPHKSYPKGQPPRLYLAGGKTPIKKSNCAVIVEGEFKAAALQQTLGDSYAVAAVPGITLVKNFDVWADILGWLKQIRPKIVIVVFDNEEHGDPALRGFKVDVKERFNAPIWARVCARRLSAEDYDARVGHLPDEWRNSEGKADWDSALAHLVKTGKTQAEIRTAFLAVLDEASKASDIHLGTQFDTNTEKFVENRVAELTYDPALPFGGRAEQAMARRLRGLARGALKHWGSRLIFLADAYEKVRGWYYELRITEQHRERLQRDLMEAPIGEELNFLRIAMKGTPSRVAPFRIIPCYILVRPDGGRDRLVKLINIRGETSPLVALDENSFTSTRDFRRWLMKQGNFGWESGEGALQALQRDINFKMAFREVIQLVAYGAERPGELWILDDCAFSPEGNIIMPDVDGVFWYAGRGYTFLRGSDGHPRGEEGQTFRLKCLPLMRPNHGLTLNAEHKLELSEGKVDEPDALRELLGSLVLHLNSSFAGYEGLMLIGAALAFFAGPEVFARFGQFPGIWISGEKGGGKTLTAKLLMAFFGFIYLEAGISFKTSSAVGFQIAMGQYANIPPWGDEFKENELRDTNIKGVIHGGFNREMPSKWSADGRTRSIRTNLIITGETTCDNAATTSRFLSVLAAREKRAGTAEDQLVRLNWLLEHRRFFFTIGRAILRQREKFAARVIHHLSLWEKLPRLAQTDPRARFSYGLAYAAFCAVNEIIPIYTADKFPKLCEWFIDQTIASAREVATRVDLNVFWEDFKSAFTSGAFGDSKADLERYFKAIKNPASKPALSEHQIKDAGEYPSRAWNSYLLYLKPGAVLAAMQQDLRRRGQQMTLGTRDLLAQMKSRSYFVPGPPQGHARKFGRGVKTNSTCWCIDVDKHEDGLIKQSDEDWARSFYPDGDVTGIPLPTEAWIDPRKGELFELIDRLTKDDDESR